jgi:hypothetical protein
MTTASEPSRNDLSPVVGTGVKREPMLLLDTTGSMSWPAKEGSKVTRIQVLEEALPTIIERIYGLDDEAAKESADAGRPMGGVMTYTFAGGLGGEITVPGDEDGDLRPDNFAAAWKAIQWGGGTEIMPGWEALSNGYVEEFGNISATERPLLLAVVITDGEATDTAQFEQALANAKGGTRVVLAIMGFGDDHDKALAEYQAIAANNDHVRVVTFGSETDPTVVADGIMSLVGVT